MMQLQHHEENESQSVSAMATYAVVLHRQNQDDLRLLVALLRSPAIVEEGRSLQRCMEAGG